MQQTRTTWVDLPKRGGWSTAFALVAIWGGARVAFDVAPDWVSLAWLASVPLVVVALLWMALSVRGVKVGPWGLEVRSGPHGIWPGPHLDRDQIAVVSMAREHVSESNHDHDGGFILDLTPASQRYTWSVDVALVRGGTLRLATRLATPDQAQRITNAVRAGLASHADIEERWTG